MFKHNKVPDENVTTAEVWNVCNGEARMVNKVWEQETILNKWRIITLTSPLHYTLVMWKL